MRKYAKELAAAAPPTDLDAFVCSVLGAIVSHAAIEPVDASSPVDNNTAAHPVGERVNEMVYLPVAWLYVVSILNAKAGIIRCIVVVASQSCLDLVDVGRSRQFP